MIKIGATDLKMNEAWVLLTIRFQPTGVERGAHVNAS